MTSSDNTQQSVPERFKQCPPCATWFSLKDILRRPLVGPIGMLLEEADPELNYFYFNHEIPGCGTTFVIPVDIMSAQAKRSDDGDKLGEPDACQGRCVRRLSGP